MRISLKLKGVKAVGYTQEVIRGEWGITERAYLKAVLKGE